MFHVNTIFVKMTSRVCFFFGFVAVCTAFKISPPRIGGLPVSSRDEVLQSVSFISKNAAAFALLNGLVVGSSSVSFPLRVAAAGNLPDFGKVRVDIRELIKTKPEKGPTLVRLAWHSSGTYDKIRKDGGSSGGTIRFEKELKHGANAGLDLAIAWLEPIYKKYDRLGFDLTYSDLYTLAGVEAIATMGGPAIPWRAGRVDDIEDNNVTPDGRLPDADKGNPMKTAQGLRDIFGRMGFNDQEIVALSGAHALGRCHATASGYVGPWTPSPYAFNNLYFVLLKGLQWTPNTEAAKLQYKDPSGKLMMLPSDLVLIEDPGFKSYVDVYAKDQKKFFSDFSAAFQKLEELGTKDLVEV